MLKDFKAFIMRGSVVDLAVGVIIGAAFGGIVKSLVDDILMPPIGLATGGRSRTWWPRASASPRAGTASRETRRPTSSSTSR